MTFAVKVSTSMPKENTKDEGGIAIFQRKEVRCKPNSTTPAYFTANPSYVVLLT